MAEPANSNWHPDLAKMVRDALKAIRFGTVSRNQQKATDDIQYRLQAQLLF